MLKTGFGYDLHRLAPGRRLWVGGIEIPSEFGSIAHSDGDALLHALIDSLLSPAGLGDIGSLFPDTDPAIKGMQSLKMLRQIKEKYLANIAIQNIDLTVILDKPKILPYLPQIKQTIAQTLEISENQIGVKGKTTENTKPFVYESYSVCLIETK
jgi:2-C-methyl-D-erythritol 2,4-cyclodiphosphate synthase